MELQLILAAAGPTEPTLPEEFDAYRVKCSACQSSFATNIENAFCKDCGGTTEVVAKIDDTVEATVESDDIVSLLCANPECNSHNIITNEEFTKGDIPAHCTVCGVEMHVETSDKGEADAKADEDSEGDSTVIDISKRRKEKEGEKDEDVLPEADPDEDDDTDGADCDSAAIAAATLALEEAADDLGDTEGEDTDTEKATIITNPPDGTVGVDFGEQTKDNDPAARPSPNDLTHEKVLDHATLDHATLEVSLVEVAESIPGDLQLSRWEDGTIQAWKGHTVIASHVKEDAGENADVFESPRYLAGLQYVVKEKGVEALSGLDFKPIVIQVELSDVITEALTQKTKDLEVSYKEKLDSLMATLTQSLSIASTGISKNFYKDKPNPIRASLLVALAPFRVPNTVVDTALAESSERYNKVVLEKAIELSQKNDEVRNEIASLITDAASLSMEDVMEHNAEVTKQEVASIQAPAYSQKGSVIKQIRDNVSGSLFQTHRSA